MTYGILSAEREEIGTRSNDYRKKHSEWERLYRVRVCFLVEWIEKDWYRVIKPIG